MISTEQEIEKIVAQSPLLGHVRCLPLGSEAQLVGKFRRLAREQLERTADECGELGRDDLRDRLRMDAPQIVHGCLEFFDRVMNEVATTGSSGSGGLRLRKVIEHEILETIHSKIEDIFLDRRTRSDHRGRISQDPRPTPMLAADTEHLASPAKRRYSVPRSIGSEQAVMAVTAYIDRRGLNITAFSNRCNLNPRSVRRFFATHQIRRSLFEAIADHMGVSAEQLLRGEVSPERKP